MWEISSTVVSENIMTDQVTQNTSHLKETLWSLVK